MKQLITDYKIYVLLLLVLLPVQTFAFDYREFKKELVPDYSLLQEQVILAGDH